MQRHAPDLLITNTSMLSAMLVREIDEPIWSQTKQWLHSTADAYFFLVLDELHLQRGTSGTEIAFLIRLLLERLGLDHPDHRHKLRILASSASLPMDGASREASLTYLWDMFGANGLGSAGKRERWSDAVISGDESTCVRASEIPIPGGCWTHLRASAVRLMRSRRPWYALTRGEHSGMRWGFSLRMTLRHVRARSWSARRTSSRQDATPVMRCERARRACFAATFR